jgi:NAD(P) transhydrogenase
MGSVPTLSHPGDLTDATDGVNGWSSDGDEKGSHFAVTETYDLIAIGSGPAGRSAAVEATRLGKRVALVERDDVLGGVSTNRGTLPSKAVRAAIVELGQAVGNHGGARRLKDGIKLDDLIWRAQQAIENERAAIQDELRRNRVDVIGGVAAFADPHVLVVQTRDGSRHVRGETIVIAVGTKPGRPAAVEFDDRIVLDSDGVLRQRAIPRRLVVVGGSVIGVEYASMAAALGVEVTVAEKRPRLLEFVDDEIVESLEYHLRGLGVVFWFGDEVESVRRLEGDGAMIHLLGGAQLPAESVLYAAGRRGATDDLNLPAAGLEADGRGRIHVGLDHRTAQTHIFAVGDVIGFPALAATAMAQGRAAALTAFDGSPRPAAPYAHAIYTIPEIAFVGRSERELAQTATPYVVGRGRYRELARGDLTGECCGLLKLVVHAETKHILGTHILGTSATELVHLGQAAIAAGLTVDYFADAVLNVPTFSEAYKVAALDARNQVS